MKEVKLIKYSMHTKELTKNYMSLNKNIRILPDSGQNPFVLLYASDCVDTQSFIFHGEGNPDTSFFYTPETISGAVNRTKDN